MAARSFDRDSRGCLRSTCCRIAGAMEASFQCRNCLAKGSSAVLGDVGAAISVGGGEVMTAAPLLPRCACCLRLHRSKLPSSITSLLADVPDVPELAAVDANSSPSQPAAQKANGPARDQSQRLIFSVDGLPASRTVPVYRGSRREGALLGSIVVNADHKLSDVMRLLHDSLNVPPAAPLYRGSLGDELRVPLPRQQHQRIAMPFFPSDDYCLIVD